VSGRHGRDTERTLQVGISRAGVGGLHSAPDSFDLGHVRSRGEATGAGEPAHVRPSHGDDDFVHGGGDSQGRDRQFAGTTKRVERHLDLLGVEFIDRPDVLINQVELGPARNAWCSLKRLVRASFNRGFWTAPLGHVGEDARITFAHHEGLELGPARDAGDVGRHRGELDAGVL
jgi:hypothetical protein